MSRFNFTLVVLALLAWLAKRWEQLEVLYKCLLISLVVHLLLMWWFRDVYPEGGEYDLEGESNRIRVPIFPKLSVNYTATGHCRW